MSIFGKILAFFRDLYHTDMTQEELHAALDERVKEQGEDLDWENSVVDLMKLVGMDSSRKARKKLAIELGYEGEYTGTAEQNIWLHGQVLDGLVKNGLPV